MAEASTLKSLEQSIFGSLLLPFTDVFCFFASDIGGFRVIAQQLAGWLRGPATSTVPLLTKPSVVIITDKICPTRQREIEARKGLLWLLQEETQRDILDLVATNEVIAIPQHAFAT
nr:hypothetical protein [Nostoc sp. EkiNYC01]